MSDDSISQQKRLNAEIQRRRTFAIISHPDAGKTTLTEKLRLYGGAIHLAGAVKAKGTARKTTSDWMDIERQRGISISTSVLRFEYEGKLINLLDRSKRFLIIESLTATPRPKGDSLAVNIRLNTFVKDDKDGAS